MAYHYGDTPTANPVTADEDAAYMAERWTRIAEQARTIVVAGSIVSLGQDEREALGHTTAWRYDIGRDRIECLFVFHQDVETFIDAGRWSVIEDHPAKVHRLPMALNAIRRASNAETAADAGPGHTD